MLQETKQQTHHVRQNQIQHQFIPHNDISKTLTVKTSCCIRNYKHGSPESKNYPLVGKNEYH